METTNALHERGYEYRRHERNDGNHPRQYLHPTLPRPKHNGNQSDQGGETVNRRKAQRDDPRQLPAGVQRYAVGATFVTR